MHEAIHAFLLGFPALFSIVNPLAGAFIFREMAAAARSSSAASWPGR